MKLFADRRQAGVRLAERLQTYAERSSAIVLALPRGGVPVAYEVAQMLAVTLDVLLVRKLGLPGNEEYAIGAIAGGGTRILHQDVIAALGLAPQVIEAIAARELRELARREAIYRAGCDPLCLDQREVILVDDGVATGASMEVAAQVVRAAGARRIVIAVPVAPVEAGGLLGSQADEVVCLNMPEAFYSVGQWYEDFEQTSDHEVIALLEHFRLERSRRPEQCGQAGGKSGQG
ncbi:MAG: phosphoribosyltransferase [Burkholderiaceae bacterium]|nr:phosphoribosyltransferase [Burkholderiaceae bacterium]